jgi:hypothetical protein
MATVPDSGAGAQHAPRWLQAIVVRGNALRRLLSATNLTISDRSNSLTIRGVGRYFPKMEGLDWAATCTPLRDADSPLSDLCSILDMLIRESVLITTDANRDAVAAFIRASI